MPGATILFLPIPRETAAQINKIDSKFPWRQLIEFWPYLGRAAELLLPPLEPTDEPLLDTPPLPG
jgi:hypothetical protein